MTFSDVYTAEETTLVWSKSENHLPDPSSHLFPVTPTTREGRRRGEWNGLWTGISVFELDGEERNLEGFP